MARTLTYNSLREIIGRKLGMTDTPSSLDTQQARDVERILADALERFYEPEIVDGYKHQWSFLQPTITLHFISGQYVYDLPANFSMMAGPITYPQASTAVWPQLQITAPEIVLSHLQLNQAAGRPLTAAIRPKDSTDIHETAYELLVYPVPDDDYDALAPIKINPLIIGADTEVPLGGQPHRQTITAACLAEAAAFNEEDERYEQRFLRKLAASIAHDRQVACPQTLGPNEDRSDWRGALGDWRDRQSYLVTYNGLNIE